MLLKKERAFDDEFGICVKKLSSLVKSYKS